MSVAFIFGTRPEVTKSAGIARVLAQNYDVRVFGLCTGQQTDLVKGTITDLSLGHILPLTWSSDRSALGQDRDWVSKTERSLPRFLEQLNIAAVVGTGDTNSVLLAARVANEVGTSFLHLEAGIRHSHFVGIIEPEEVNRRMITKLTTLNLCPAAKQRTNLMDEEVDNSRIQVIGDLSAAAITEVWRVRRARLASSEYFAGTIIPALGRVCVCTFHRSTSLQYFDSLIFTFNELVRYFPSVTFVLATRPDTRWERFYNLAQGAANVRLMPALPPTEFQELLTRSDIVLTDSAGVQQEGVLLSKPVIALRNNVELYAGDPLLSIVAPPFYGLFQEFGRVLALFDAPELGLSNVNRNGNLVIDRGARMISAFCSAKNRNSIGPR